MVPLHHALEGGHGRRQNDKDPVVPRVFLHATDESALSNGVSMEELKRFAAEPEVPGGGGSLEKKAPVQPGVTGGIAKEV